MLKPKRRFLIASAILSSLATAAMGQSLPDPSEGYLCCNMRVKDAWISDSNYAGEGVTVVPLGTPMKVTGFGRFRAHVELAGRQMDLGNDYSRDLEPFAFVRRYLVAEDPTKKLATFPPDVRDAIVKMKVKPGMTREQVMMSLGPPLTRSTPNLSMKYWQFWLGSFQKYQVVFEGDVVKEINGDAATKALVIAE